VKRTSKVPAVDNALRMLVLLSNSRVPLQASMIAQRLDLPRSSVYHLLNVLVEHGFVMRLEEERRYGLGIAASELALASQRQESLAVIARGPLASLVRVGDCSAQLAVLVGREVEYIAHEQGPRSPHVVTRAGIRYPAERTAPGRAMLAVLPPAQIRALYPSADAFGDAPTAPGASVAGSSPAEALVEGAPPVTSITGLRVALRDVLDRGHATESGEIVAGLSSIAVPVLDHRSWPTAAVCATFSTGALSDAELRALVDRAQNAADEIADRIHGRPLHSLRVLVS